VRHTGYADAKLKERKRQRDWNILLNELVRFPEDSFVLYNLGMIAFERNRWQEALDCFQRSMTYVGKSPSLESLQRKLFSMIAWTHQIQGNMQESLQTCNEGLSADPEDAELLFRKAVAYRYLGETMEAESCWRAILGLRRAEKFCSIDQGIYGHLTRRNLAIIARERGDHSEAETQIRAVLEECPGDPDGLRQLREIIAYKNIVDSSSVT